MAPPSPPPARKSSSSPKKVRVSSMATPPMPVSRRERDMEADEAMSGKWLFKQAGVVHGPVVAQVILERIQRGELDGDDGVAREAGVWRRVIDVSAFARAHEQAVASRLEQEAQHEWERKVGRARVIRVVLVLVIASLSSAAGAALGHEAMKRKPWDTTAQWAERVPRVVEPTVRDPEPPSPAPAPVEKPSSEQGSESPSAPVAAEAQGEAPGVQKPAEFSKPVPEVRTTKERNRRDKEKEKERSKARATEKEKASDQRGTQSRLALAKQAKEEHGEQNEKPASSNLPETLTDAQATAPLKNAGSKLKACFKQELAANPDVPLEVLLSYTVTEEGRAANVILENRELRGRPIQACVQSAIGALRWPRFSGERKNVIVPLRIGKPKQN